MYWDKQDALEMQQLNSIYENLTWEIIPQVTSPLKILLGKEIRCNNCCETNWDEFYYIHDNDEHLCWDCCRTLSYHGE